MLKAAEFIWLVTLPLARQPFLKLLALCGADLITAEAGRATANGMEGAAAMFNDGLLALDEISECDPREIGAIIYALGNGVGKQRASRTGSAKSVTRWRCMVLSSGERTIGTAMQEGGHRVKAGQSMRLLDIPVDRRFGAFDELHGFTAGSALSGHKRGGQVFRCVGDKHELKAFSTFSAKVIECLSAKAKIPCITGA